MRFACWISKATNTHSEYVILIVIPLKNGYANAPQCYVIRALLLFVNFRLHVVCMASSSSSAAAAAAASSRSLSYEMSVASSEATSPESVIWCFLFQPLVPSPFFEVRSCLRLIPRLPIPSIFLCMACPIEV
jgi:hypothetical protein